MSVRGKDLFRKSVDQVEETLIAVFLGLMTLITFSNVIARYVFNENLLWALEATLFLFAWLVLLGMSYCVKKQLHIGIDVVVTLFPKRFRRWLALFGISVCLAFSLLRLKGSWDYWFPFVTSRAFLETEDVPIPGFLQFLSDWLNEGESYEKLPRFIPYFALPLGAALLTFRFLELGWRIGAGKSDGLIHRHKPSDLKKGR